MVGFRAAKAASRKSNGDRIGRKLGAAILRSGNVLALGWNIYDKSHTKSEWSSTHAEQGAIIDRQHYDDISKCTIYVYREKIINPKTGKTVPANSMPCENCFKIIKSVGIGIVRYFDNDGTPREIRI